MSKQEKSKKRDKSLRPRLDLVNIGITYFHWKGQKYSVKEAPAPIFDEWISQYVEDIQNVDRAIWSTHHRWNIINDVLGIKALDLKALTTTEHLLTSMKELFPAHSEAFSSELTSEMGDKSASEGS